MQSWK